MKADIATLPLDSQCHAKSKQSGARCKKTAEPGQRVCRMHGGASPQARAAALERLRDARDSALERLNDALDTYGDQIPPKELLEITVKLTDKVELLEGRVTERKESVRVDTDEVRDKVLKRLADLAERKERRPQVLAVVESMEDTPGRRVHHG